MANTTTPNISLLEPALGDSSWNTPLNFNFTQIDSCFGGTVPVPALAITGAFTEGSGGVVGFSSNANPTLAVADTGLSRIAVKTIAIGSGAQGDATGNLQLALITKYAGLTTAGTGVTAITAITSQKSESAADAALLSFTPPALAGSYRVRFVLSVATATAAVVGWTITYHDSNGTAQAPTNLSLLQMGTAAPALTFTTSTTNTYSGEVNIDIDNSATAIVVKFTLGSGSLTSKATATIERLI